MQVDIGNSNTTKNAGVSLVLNASEANTTALRIQVVLLLIIVAATVDHRATFLHLCVVYL